MNEKPYAERYREYWDRIKPLIDEESDAMFDGGLRGWTPERTERVKAARAAIEKMAAEMPREPTK
jgi:hypothetical protein